MDKPCIGNCNLKRGIHMVTVTDAAGAHLAQLLAQVDAQEDTVIRLVLDKDDLVPKMDQARVGDTAFSYEGRRILVLDEIVVQAMADKTLDVQDAEDGLKIVLN
jgi:Fe-S cluster assembly iron-binding protein IscA